MFLNQRRHVSVNHNGVFTSKQNYVINLQYEVLKYCHRDKDIFCEERLNNNNCLFT
jgi:hypothetical protein